MADKKRKTGRSLEEEHALQQLGEKLERRKKIDKPFIRHVDWYRRRYGLLLVVLGPLFLLGAATLAWSQGIGIGIAIAFLPGLVFTGAGIMYLSGKFDE